MYSCFKCGSIYEKDGVTPYESKPGEVLMIFSMIWNCPECVKKERFEKRRQTLDTIQFMGECSTYKVDD